MSKRQLATVPKALHKVQAFSVAEFLTKNQVMPQQLKLLYDGQCSLCRGAMEGMKRRDAKGLIVPEDISNPAFDPARYGLTAEQVRTAMYVVLPDGRVLCAMDAVRGLRCCGTRLAGRHGVAGHPLAGRRLLPFRGQASSHLQPHAGPEVRFR